MVSQPRPTAAATNIIRLRRPIHVYSPSTTNPTTAASDKYMRLSAIGCSVKGITLELGARITKNHAPTKPRGGHRQSAIAVLANNTARIGTYGNTMAGF